MQPDTNDTNATTDTNPTTAAEPPKERKPRTKRTLDERIDVALAGARSRYEMLSKREVALAQQLEQVRTERRTLAGELTRRGVQVDNDNGAELERRRAAE